MKLIVATLLLAALALGAKLAVGHLAPEKVASASVRFTADEVGAAPDAIPWVRSVRITGDDGLRPTSIASELETRADAPLDRRALDADRLRVVRALSADGYLDASVDTPRVRSTADGVTVELPVVTGTRYQVRAVRLEGRQLVRHAELAAVPTLRAGEDAIGERIDGNVALLRGWLADRGVAASVGVRVDVDRYTQVVDVTFVAE